MVNKVGAGSLIVGLILLLAVWFIAFAPHSASLGQALFQLCATTFVGGLVLLGLFLMLVGALILII